MKVAASVMMDGGVWDGVLMAPPPYQTHFSPGNDAGTLDFPGFMSPDPVSPFLVGGLSGKLSHARLKAANRELVAIGDIGITRQGNAVQQRSPLIREPTKGANYPQSLFPCPYAVAVTAASGSL